MNRRKWPFVRVSRYVIAASFCGMGMELVQVLLGKGDGDELWRM